MAGDELIKLQEEWEEQNYRFPCSIKYFFNQHPMETIKGKFYAGVSNVIPVELVGNPIPQSLLTFGSESKDKLVLITIGSPAYTGEYQKNMVAFEIITGSINSF